MLRRCLSMLLALAVVAAPCSMIGADQSLAANANKTMQAAAGHTHETPAATPHCPGESGGYDQACATDCHAWNVSSVTVSAYEQSKHASVDTGFASAALALITTEPSVKGPPPIVFADTLALAFGGPVYARTQRLRL